MSGTINGFNDFLPPEILGEVFKYSDFGSHLNAALVCKDWNAAMQSYSTVKNYSSVTCLQLINKYQSEVERQAAGFLSMVPQKLEAYCVKYDEKMKYLKNNYRQLKPKDVMVHLTNNNFSENLTVSFYEFVRVDPASSYIPKEVEKDLRGKIFVRLACLEKNGSRMGGLWNDPKVSSLLDIQIKYLPIELFRAKIDKNVVLEKQNEKICFVIQERLKQFQVVEKIPGDSDESEKRRCVVETITLSSEYGPSLCKASNFYVPRLHAARQPSRYLSIYTR